MRAVPVWLVLARMAARTLLGRRSALLLLVPTLVLVGIAALVRGLSPAGEAAALVDDLLAGLALGVVVPLLGLVVGTGVVAPEVDDGTIVYTLARPVRRSTVVLAKWGVATLVVAAAGAAPVAAAGVLLRAEASQVVGYAVAAAAAGAAYAALFLLLGLASRNAVVVGLVYVVVWESVVGTFVPGAQDVSVQQWALALGNAVARAGGAVASAVGTTTGLLLPVLVVAALAVSVQRLRSFALREV